MTPDAKTAIRAAWGATIPDRVLGHFFANLARLLNSGIVISESVLTASRGLDPELQRICEAIAPRLQTGVAIDKALEPYRLRFPEMTLPVLEVGQVAGTLDQACERLSGAFQRIDGFDKRFEDVAVEPKKMILGGTLFAVLFQAGADPVQALKVALTTALSLTLLYIACRILWHNRFRWPRFHVLVDKIHLAIPHVGAIERNLATARWGRSFATMWHAGVPITQALEVSSRSTLNAYYEQEMRGAVAKLMQGTGLSESLSHMELVPRHQLPLLHVGEQTAEFGAALDKFVDALEDEALVKAQQETTGAIVMGYLIAGLVVLFIAFSLRGAMG